MRERTKVVIVHIVLLTLIAAFCGTIATLASGQELHQHPPEDQAIHDRFYKTWMMPDHPQVSCCNDRDCYPTEARFISGHWQARRREDGVWLVVPDKKVETVRDNPDGRSHMCAPAPGHIYASEVFCFIPGGGA